MEFRLIEVGIPEFEELVQLDLFRHIFRYRKKRFSEGFFFHIFMINYEKRFSNLGKGLNHG